MTQFSAESVLAFYHAAIEDDAASIARSNHHGNRCLAAGCAKDRVMSPQGSRICIVQVGHRLAEFLREAFADIESRPLLMHEVCLNPRAKPPGGTGPTGGVQPDRDPIPQRNAAR